MTDPLCFHASLWRLTTDREGEARLTLDVPESDLAQVVQIIRWKEMALKVTVQPEGASHAD